MKSCWVLINPDAKKNYLATPGNRYAALLSVDARASLSDVTDELAKLGFKVTYSWQSGQENRDSVFIDNWIARLPAPTKGTVWMYFELNYVGDVPKTIVGRSGWMAKVGTEGIVKPGDQVTIAHEGCATL